MRHLGLIALASLALAACGESAGLAPPADASVDATVAQGADAGVVADASAPEDAASDDAGFVEDAAAPDAEPADTGAMDASAPRTTTLYPIVMVHGFGASAMRLGYAGVAADLVAHGHAAWAVDVPPFDSSEVRATYLADAVDAVLAETGAAKVNIIAHSMGGLDARHLISGLGYGDRVASLSTVATPHRGSAFADVTLGLQAGASTVAVNALAAIFGNRISDLDADTQVRAALTSCSEAAAPAFNAAHPDDPRVYYQSWAGLSNAFGIASPNDERDCETLLFDPNIRDPMDALLLTTAGIVAHGIRVWPNDGLVAVTSAKWGEYHGCLPADHLDEVGEFADRPPNAITGFDYLQFYRDLVAGLMNRGL